MAQHRAGGKITRSHTTVIDAALPLVDFLQGHPAVNKIVLGLIKNIGRGQPGLKFHPVVGGWKIVVRGNISLQELVIYTSTAQMLRSEIQTWAELRKT